MKKLAVLFLSVFSASVLFANDKNTVTSSHSKREKIVTPRTEVLEQYTEKLDAGSYIAIPFAVHTNTKFVDIHASSDGNSVKYVATNRECLNEYKQGKELRGYYIDTGKSFTLRLATPDENGEYSGKNYLQAGTYYLVVVDETGGLFSHKQSNISYTITREYDDISWGDVKADPLESEICELSDSIYSRYITDFASSGDFKSLHDAVFPANMLGHEKMDSFTISTGKTDYTVKVKPYAGAGNTVNLVFYQQDKKGVLQEVQSVEVNAIDQRFAILDFDCDGIPEIISSNDGPHFDFVKWNAKAKKFERTSYFKDYEGANPMFSEEKKLVVTCDGDAMIGGGSGYTDRVVIDLISFYRIEKGTLKKLYDFKRTKDTYEYEDSFSGVDSENYGESGVKFVFNDGKKTKIEIFVPENLSNLQTSEKQTILKQLKDLQTAIQKIQK